MKKVTGIGGIFFKSRNVPALRKWYRDHLGFRTTDWGASFIWNETDPSITALGRTEWSPFKDDTDYFNPGTEPFMINYRVHDLRRLIDTLKSENVQIAGGIEDTDYGKFAWIMDNEGRKIELWEPPMADSGETPPTWTDRVTGLGGVFFKSNDPQAAKDWYKKHLDVGEHFSWKDVTNPAADARTVWSPLEPGSMFFEQSDKPYMFNYRVKDLPGLMEKLKKEGVKTSEGFETYPHGKFAWAFDPEGTKMALWEP
jgi:predicted enzyme related to lactoylglutathione lyase